MTCWQAQRELLKLKNVIKVQAAVRGFLVRRHAVGTLRCAQAIVKMQAIVRARRARLSPEGSAPDELDKKNEKENPGSKIMVILLVFKSCHLEKLDPPWQDLDVILVVHCFYLAFCFCHLTFHKIVF